MQVYDDRFQAESGRKTRPYIRRFSSPTTHRKHRSQYVIIPAQNNFCFVLESLPTSKYPFLGKNAERCRVQTCGTHSYHCALKDQIYPHILFIAQVSILLYTSWSFVSNMCEGFGVL